MDRYAGAMPDSFFRQLDPQEEALFRQWARDNHSARRLFDLSPGRAR